MKDYLQKILTPYVDEKRKQLKLSPDYPAMVLFDKFTGTQELFHLLEANHIHFVVVPANCTDRLQPLDLSVNKPVKEFLRKQFHTWYAQQICQQLKNGSQVPIDLKLSTMKPL